MRGIDNIIRMRLGRTKPAMVNVELFPMQSWTKVLASTASRFVDIHMEERDVSSIELADLRCLHGLKVTVRGPDTEATEKVAVACFNAGAVVVEAFFFAVKPSGADIVKAMRYSDEGVRTVWPH